MNGLKDKEILMNNNEPYQKYIENGWFVVEERVWESKKRTASIYIDQDYWERSAEDFKKAF